MMPGHDSKQGRSFLLDEDAKDQLARDAGRANLLDAPATPEDTDKGAGLRAMVSAVDKITEAGKQQVSQAQAGISTIVGDPSFRQQNPVMAGIATMADLALQWGTAAFGAAAGATEALGNVATAGDSFGPPMSRGEAIEKIPEVFSATAEALTFGPLTPQGQQAAEVTDTAIKILAKMRKGAGQWVFEQTNSPALATATEVTLAGVTIATLPAAIKRSVRDIKATAGNGFDAMKGAKKDSTPGPKTPDQPEMVLAEAASKEVSTVPSKTRAAVERGHIKRAERLARQQGITYGEAIREVVGSTENPASMQHLVPVKGPRELLIGEDTRIFGAMKDSIFEETQLPSGKTTNRPVIPDINVLRRDLTTLVAPHKFLADRHPVLKWGIDKMDRADRNVEAKSNDILWGMELVPERFGTARREGVPHKSERGALTIFEKLPLNEQIQILNDAQPSNLEGRAITEAEKASWNGVQRLAYKQLRLGTDIVLKEINRSAKVTGGTGIQARPGYLPNIWTGDFRVFIRDIKGKLVKVVGASTRRQANAVKRGIETDMKGYKASVEAVKRRGKEGASIEAFQAAIDRKSTRLNSSHTDISRMPSSA